MPGRRRFREPGSIDWSGRSCESRARAARSVSTGPLLVGCSLPRSMGAPLSTPHIAENQKHLAGFDNDLEVMPVNRGIGPPSILHHPLIAHGNDMAIAAIDCDGMGLPGRSCDYLDCSGLIEASYGTIAHSRSGSRDQGSIASGRMIAMFPCVPLM